MCMTCASVPKQDVVITTRLAIGDILLRWFHFRTKNYLHQKYSLMHQDYSRAISSVSLSYIEVFKIKAIKVLIL